MIPPRSGAAVTHSGCSHFSRAPNLCWLPLYVRFILCRRDSRFQSPPAVGHPVAARHRRPSAFIQFLRIAQYSDHVSNCLATLRDNKLRRERLSQLDRLYEGPVPARHAGPREHNDTLCPVAESMLWALNPSLVPDAFFSFFASIRNTHLATSSDSTLSREAFFALNQPGAKGSVGCERTERTESVQHE